MHAGRDLNCVILCRDSCNGESRRVVVVACRFTTYQVVLGYGMPSHMYICMSVCMYVCMYVCTSTARASTV